MNLSSKNLLFYFLIALALTIATPAFYPKLRLAFFAPFLIIMYYQKSYPAALWYSLICGLLLDLLGGPLWLGFHGLVFCLTTAIIYNQRWHLFADSFTTLPLMTFLFSFVSTLIQTILLYIFSKPLAISWAWFFTDLIAMPLVDALFGFTFFILPFVFLGSRPRRGKDYFTER